MEKERSPKLSEWRRKNDQWKEQQTEQLTMSDGTSIFLRSWLNENAPVLLVLHGIGAHSGWYASMASELATAGLTVYAMDHRGHGQSGGDRSYIRNGATFIDDIESVIEEIRRRHPGQKPALLGHSMGGIFATYVAARAQDKLSSVLFLNPWVQEKGTPQIGTVLRILGGGIVGSKRYWQVSNGAEQMTFHQEARDFVNQDPLWQRQQTARFLWEIFKLKAGILRAAKGITIPAIVMQAGDDLSVQEQATKRLFQQLSSIDKEWVRYEGYAHDSQFEVDRSLLDADIFRWVKGHEGAS